MSVYNTKLEIHNKAVYIRILFIVLTVNLFTLNVYYSMLLILYLLFYKKKYDGPHKVSQFSDTLIRSWLRHRMKMCDEVTNVQN